MYLFARLNIYNHITKFSKNNYCTIRTKIWEIKNDLSKLSKIIFKMFVDRFYVVICFLISKPPKRYSFLRLLKLHRKEVIHPHLPVGIPCYDLSPVTSPILGDPLPCGLGYRLRILLTPMPWRAVCTTPGNVFTPTFWFGITSDSNFVKSSCRLQSGLGPTLKIC